MLYHIERVCGPSVQSNRVVAGGRAFAAQWLPCVHLGTTLDEMRSTPRRVRLEYTSASCEA